MRVDTHRTKIRSVSPLGSCGGDSKGATATRSRADDWCSVGGGDGVRRSFRFASDDFYTWRRIWDINDLFKSYYFRSWTETERNDQINLGVGQPRVFVWVQVTKVSLVRCVRTAWFWWMNEITYRFPGEGRPFRPSRHDEGVIFLKFVGKVECKL